MLSESTPNSEERRALALFLRDLDTGHTVHGNSQGGYDCTCGEGWDWQFSEQEAANLHASKFVADAVLAAGYRPQEVQHCWIDGEPFCGDENAKVWTPATTAESNARPICALCHKRAMHFQADEFAKERAALATTGGETEWGIAEDGKPETVGKPIPEEDARRNVHDWNREPAVLRGARVAAMVVKRDCGQWVPVDPTKGSD